MLQINDKIGIPDSELEFSYSRSSGPGGQNVNKVNTKATLRWSVEKNRTVPAAVRKRFSEKYGNRINSEGEIVLYNDSSREQRRNTENCLATLRAMLLSVLKPPAKRVPTKFPRGLVEKRLSDKKSVSHKKKQRKPPDGSEDY